MNKLKNKKKGKEEKPEMVLERKLKVATSINSVVEIDKNLYLPPFNLSEKIFPDTWLNVPQCVGEALYPLMDHFKYYERMCHHLNDKILLLNYSLGLSQKESSATIKE